MTTIRLATPRDAQGMLDIYAPYVRETAVTFEYQVPDLAEFRGRIRDTLPRYPWLAAEADGQLLGYAYAGRYRGRAAFQWDAEGSIYLRPQAQGTGLAVPLYRCLMELLKLQGIRNFYGCITHPNPASQGFHRKLGFLDLAVFPNAGYKLGQWRGVLWNYLPLVEASGPPDPFRPFGELEPEAIAAILKAFNRQLGQLKQPE